ncbi:MULTISPECIES: siderophore-interacting protein [unclassified Sinorhizobium]|uniref:siderophore-interacting protein n=1 Tax=unclassified Sinorhizobium TaxID=2613772 RepID=UPI0035255A8D
MSGFQVLEVLRVRDVAPWLRRVTFGGEEFSRMNLDPNLMGPHVKVLLPPYDIGAPEWPARVDGRIIWPAQERRPAMRTYSVRRFDTVAGELDIEFVMHGDEGIASRWAANVRPGEIAGIWGPGGQAPGSPVDWYLLGGDLTAVPAIAYVLENLPQGAAGHVVIEPNSADQFLPLKAPSGVEIRWVAREGKSSRLHELMTAIRPPRDARPFVWGGAEASIARELRAHFRKAEGFDRRNCYILNYWKQGVAEGSFGCSE